MSGDRELFPVVPDFRYPRVIAGGAGGLILIVDDRRRRHGLRISRGAELLMRFLHSVPGRSVSTAAGFALLLVGGAEIPITAASAAMMTVGWLLVAGALLDASDHGHWHRGQHP